MLPNHVLPDEGGDASRPGERREIMHAGEPRQVTSTGSDFETLVNHAPICIHEIDLSGRLVTMNPAGLAMVNMSLADVTGMHYLDFVAEPDRARVGRLLDEARFEGRSSEFEFTIEVDGDVLHFASGFVPVHRDDGTLDRLMGLTQDITERTRALQSSRASQDRFRDFAETAADFFWEVDADLRFTDACISFESAIGLEEGAATGVALPTLWTQLSSDGLDPKLRADLDARRPFQDVEVRWQLRRESAVTIALSGRPIYEDGNFTGYRGSGRDVTDLHALASRLAYQASHDELTGLTNRREFERQLAELVGRQPPADTTPDSHVLCFLDLDQFKVVNDTCGHVAGDELLRQVASLLRANVRRADPLARLGGDEFAILMQYCSIDRAKVLLDTILESLSSMRFEWGDRVFGVGASIGVAALEEGSGNVTELFRAVDTACYAAKDLGRNRVVVFQDDDDALSRRQAEIRSVSRITTALDEGAFELYAQPIVATAPGVTEPGGFEVLVRMTDPATGSLILPGDFLSAAERFGLATRLDLWVLENTLAALERHNSTTPGLCSINLSATSLSEESFLDEVRIIIEGSSTDPTTICFEITETTAITNLAHATQFIETLSVMGCRFALDDFGSGMASFAYLKNLSVDFIKIDGTFVRDILTDPVDRALVRSITEIGTEMGKRVIAEWVENAEILAELHDIGVHYAQGFVFGRPVPLAELLADSD